MGEMTVAERVLTIGRDATCDLRFDGSQISNLHARLIVQDQRVYIEDAGSSNGTWLNGQRLRGPAPLSPGDEVGFGSFRVPGRALLDRIHAAAPSAPSPFGVAYAAAPAAPPPLPPFGVVYAAPPPAYATARRGPSRLWTPEQFRYPWFHFLLWTLIGLPTCVILIGIPALITGGVFWHIFLYRAWDQAQAFSTRATPGQAVGFCFIPFFGFYWCFIAYKGLAEDMNRHAMAIGLPPHLRVSEGLVLACCILWIVSWIVSWIPYVGFLVVIPQLVCYFMVASQFKNVAMAIAARNTGEPLPV